MNYNEKIKSINNVINSLHVDNIVTTLIEPENSKAKMLKAMEDICHSGFIPNPEEQLETIKTFIDGKMSYAEMRSRCG